MIPLHSALFCAKPTVPSFQLNPLANMNEYNYYKLLVNMRILILQLETFEWSQLTKL